MNRAARRAKAKPQARRRYVRPLPHEVDMVFFDIDKFFRQLSEGLVDIDEKGVLVHQSLQGEKYQTLPAIMGFMSVWRRMSNHFKLGIDVQPVEKLCKRLEFGMPITPEEVEACKAIIANLRRIYARLNAYEVKSVVNTELIALELHQPGVAK